MRRPLVLVFGMLVGACGGGEDPPRLLTDMSFNALVDQNGDGVIHDEAMSPVALSDYLAANRPGTRILMVNSAAGWCEPCQREAAAMADLDADYAPRGVAIVTAIFQDQNGDPCNETFMRSWAETFQLSVPVLLDDQFQTGAYFQANVMPANMFVDAETSEILLIATGAETGDDPLRAYREFLDATLGDP